METNANHARKLSTVNNVQLLTNAKPAIQKTTLMPTQRKVNVFVLMVGTLTRIKSAKTVPNHKTDANNVIQQQIVQSVMLKTTGFQMEVESVFVKQDIGKMEKTANYAKLKFPIV